MAAARRWLVWGAALALMVGSLASGVVPADAAKNPRTFQIGVDNAAPKGHDWLYVDFFPRAGVKIHRGDVLDFSWNTGSIDGFHSVAFTAGAQPEPLAVVDGDDPFEIPNVLPQLEANPKAFFPSNPACGTKANPCTYNGTTRITSGGQPNAPGFDYFVKVDVAPGTITYVCEIHPGMQGSLTVVPDDQARSTADQVEDAAEAQLNADTRGARQAEDAAEDAAVSHATPGTRTVNVIAGTASRFVAVTEMLPRRIDIKPGDKVTWTTRTIKDIHTVTFPQGNGSIAVDPLVNVCGGTPDTPAASPAACKTPADFEVHINAQPQGPTAITSPRTVATSGLLANPPAPFPNTFTFSFPKEGTFTYQCRIHDHMVGTIRVDD